MKITSIKTAILLSPLKVPFKTAVRSVEAMTDVIVRIDTDGGISGWGSAPPTAKVTGDTIGSITGAINEYIRPLLLGKDADNIEYNLDLLDSSLLRNTSAKAAVDIALHDLWAKSLNEPAWKLFGGNGHEIETDVTISINSPEEMATDAVRAQKDGFRIIKIKVGNNTDIDFLRLKAIRDAVGKDIKLRIDANQGWKPTEAVRILNRFQDAGLDIELVEQPVRSNDIKGLSYVTAHSPIPVVADESCWSPEDAIRLLYEGTVNIVNIKLMKCGGIRSARSIVGIANAVGAEVMMGCMLECKISCAAAIHIASSSSCVTRIDIDGPVLCAEDMIEGGPIFNGGPIISTTSDPGFGIKGIKGINFNND